MEMKWSDLESGDVIRYKKELGDIYKPINTWWTDKWCNKDITIREVIILDRYIQINFVVPNYGNVRIKYDGSSYDGFGEYSGVLFDIVKLRDE